MTAYELRKQEEIRQESIRQEKSKQALKEIIFYFGFLTILLTCSYLFQDRNFFLYKDSLNNLLIDSDFEQVKK